MTGFNKILILNILAGLFLFGSVKENKHEPGNACSGKNFIEYDLIYDQLSLFQELIIGKYPANSLNWYNRDKNDKLFDSEIFPISSLPAHIFEERIAELNKTTPIVLEYNKYVADYIYAYGVLNKDKIKSILELSAFYFPIFEEYLAAYNLPLELKYLAAVESALDPEAVSVSGAVGLWQFMVNTSDVFDLKINSYIDERRDVFKSTRAACAYLEFLHRTFNDWHLALAAYNGGPGMVVKAIARSGGKTNYWELRPYFTNQMQNFVPAFIAMTYILNYHHEHDIVPDIQNINAFFQYDTLHIIGPLHFKQIENVIGLPEQKISKLNPVFLQNKIPDDNKPYSLILPKNYVLKFLLNQPRIYMDRPYVENYLDMVNRAGDTTNLEKVYHRVIQGETLNRIAIQYGVTIKNIIAWNELPEDYVLRFDDVLKIWIDNNK